MGYLANTGDLTEEGIRQALVFGSVMASFNVEDFSLERMKRLDYREIEARFRSFKSLKASGSFCAVNTATSGAYRVAAEAFIDITSLIC